jgi:hypothetical protein
VLLRAALSGAAEIGKATRMRDAAGAAARGQRRAPPLKPAVDSNLVQSAR